MASIQSQVRFIGLLKMLRGNDTGDPRLNIENERSDGIPLFRGCRCGELGTRYTDEHEHEGDKALDHDTDTKDQKDIEVEIETRRFLAAENNSPTVAAREGIRRAVRRIAGHYGAFDVISIAVASGFFEL
ncbi:MAG: hypothetical protein M1835_007327 [Candelina submexicana]|nr:MAG: hypothetical protein M1835_007327 [Candelina submexicana]